MTHAGRAKELTENRDLAAGDAEPEAGTLWLMRR